jgi:hypothetical protein
MNKNYLLLSATIAICGSMQGKAEIQGDAAQRQQILNMQLIKAVKDVNLAEVQRLINEGAQADMIDPAIIQDLKHKSWATPKEHDQAGNMMPRKSNDAYKILQILKQNGAGGTF